MKPIQKGSRVYIHTHTPSCYDGSIGTVVATITHDRKRQDIPGYEYNFMLPDGWFRVKLDATVDIGMGVMTTEDIFAPFEVESLL